jgi:hypothetical protein
LPSASAVSSSPNVLEILTYGGDITFIGGGTMKKSLVISPPSFAWQTSQTTIMGQQVLNFGNDEQGEAHAPVDIPDGATITSYKCAVNDSDSENNGFVSCVFSLREFGFGSAQLIDDIFTTAAFDGGNTILVSDDLDVLVDRNANSYSLTFRTFGCENECSFYSAKIAYTVPSGMVVGGTFYPVDNVSLVLAYGLVNSWWMAPIGLGIGVGIYLTASRWNRR